MKEIFENIFRPVSKNPLDSIIAGTVILFYIVFSEYFPELFGIDQNAKNDLLKIALFVILLGFIDIVKNIIENIIKKVIK